MRTQTQRLIRFWKNSTETFIKTKELDLHSNSQNQSMVSDQLE